MKKKKNPVIDDAFQWEYEIQGRYVGPWDLMTTVDTLQTAKIALNEYNDNCPGIQFRIKKVKSQRM